MKILFYNAATVSKIDSLRRMFNHYILPGTGIELVEANQHTMLQALDDDVRVFIMPGARESNAYRTEITGANFDRLLNCMDRGMNVLGICAGAYVLAKDFEFSVYDEVTGALNEKRHVSSSLGIVDIKAFGPDQRLYTQRPREEGNPWSVYSVVDVEFDSEVNGEARTDTVALAISRAPSFCEPSTSQCSVMARYKLTGDAAMVQFGFGQGGGVLAGPALEVGGHNLTHYVHPRYQNDPYSQEVMNRLFKAASAWNNLVLKTFKVLLPGEEKIHRQIHENLLTMGVSLENPIRQQIRQNVALG